MANKLFPKDHWSPPDIDPTRPGDKEQARLCFAVGNATTIWESVEDAVATLMQVLSNVKDGNSLLVVRHMFGVVESSSMRLKIVESLAALYYSHYWARDEIRSPFKDLLNNISKASWRRNDFAHGTIVDVTTISVDKDGAQVGTEHGAFLVAPEYMIARQRAFYSDWNEDDPLAFIKSNYRYTSSDILTFVQKFRSLHDAIWMYIDSCKMEPSGHPANVLALMKAEAKTAAEADTRKARRAMSKVQRQRPERDS